MGEGKGVYRGLVGKPEVKRPLERPRRRWEDNIKVDLQEVGSFAFWGLVPYGLVHTIGTDLLPPL
jgi:hypothetical protein